MFVRSFGVIGVLALGGLYMTGLIGGASFSRNVGKPQAEVMKALEDLDITEQPGSPGTDPAAAGGVKPVFQLSKTPDSLIWTVMSGDKIATQMIAHFEPVDDGKGTHVTAEVQRGDAPDDFVSPAFRSKGLTMALFGMALESELNELVTPAHGWNEDCDRIMARFQAGNEGNVDMQHHDGVVDALGDGAIVAMKLNAMESELRRAGCNTNQDGQFRSVESRMTTASSEPAHREPEVRFEPGKPMMDLSSYNKPHR
jgi:hypothetical protein